MFERYTEAARRALFFARYEVTVDGGRSLGTEHLLLGVLRECRGMAERLLDAAGARADRLQAELTARPRAATRLPTSAEIPFSEDARDALLRAADEADRLDDGAIGPEHLLVALSADASTMAGAILSAHGFRHEAARRQLDAWRAEPVAPTPAPTDVDELFDTFADHLNGEPAAAPRLRMYTDLARWWPLLSPPSHYVEEAADLLPTLLTAGDGTATTLLELGSGGGSLAHHLKDRLRLTLTDLSPEMIAVNRAANPECEHFVGDMRTLDLGRTFDLVLIHDAIMYATDEGQLRATLATAARHLRPDGGLVVVPDCVAETFEPATECGGEDAPDGRGLRYLEWSWDPDRGDTTFEVAYGFLLREADGTVRTDLDRHTEGLFPRASWLAWLADAGFAASVRTDPWNRDVFIGRRV